MMSGLGLWNKFLVWTVAFTLLSLFEETQGFDETSVDSLACKEQPCGKEEAGECNIYHQGSGCSQCANGFFKLSSNHACVDCQEFFGSECLHCSDGNGCQQCTSNGYFRQEANYKNLTFWYCDDDVCNDESSHCKTCNNGKCSQCMSGYFRMLNSYDQYECLDCSNVNVTGEGCLHCSDFNGCQQCQDGYALKHKKNKKNGMIYNQCVEDKPPSLNCTIKDTDLRLLFLDAEYNSNHNYWCYNYNLKILKDDVVDTDYLKCKSDSETVTWSLDFSCNYDFHDFNDTSLLEYYLASVDIVGDDYDFTYYVDPDGVLYVYTDIPDDGSEETHFVKYKLCFDNDESSSVNVIDKSTYCVNDVDGTMHACSDIYIPDVCGESENINPNFTDYYANNTNFTNVDATHNLTLRYDITAVPKPNTTYSFDDDNTTNSTGNVTVNADLIVPRIWWIKRCETVDSTVMAVIFDYNYVNEDYFADKVNQPLTLPVYDRLVAPVECNDVQGWVNSWQTNLDTEEFILFVDRSMPEIAVFGESDFEIDELEFIQMDHNYDETYYSSGEFDNSTWNDTYINDTFSTTSSGDSDDINEEEKCVIFETEEEFLIETQKDLNYIENVIRPYAIDNNLTLICFRSSNVNDYSNYTTINETGTNFTTVGNVSTVFYDQDDFNNDTADGNGTDVDIRRRLFFKKLWRAVTKPFVAVWNGIKTVVNTVISAVGLLFGGTKSFQKTVFEHRIPVSYKSDLGSCNSEIDALIQSKVGMGLTIRLIPLHFDLWVLLRVEGNAVWELDCDGWSGDYGTDINIPIKKFYMPKKTVAVIFFIPVHIQGVVNIGAKLELDTTISYSGFTLTVGGSVYQQVRIGVSRSRGFYTDFDNGFSSTFDLSTIECALSIEAEAHLYVEPAVEIGIFYVNGVGFGVFVEVPKLEFSLNYPPAIESGDTLCDDYCNWNKRNFKTDKEFRVGAALGVFAYVPALRVKLFGKTWTLWEYKELARRTLWQTTFYEKRGCLNLPVPKVIGDLCCLELPTTPDPTPVPVIQPSPTPKPTARPTNKPTSIPTNRPTPRPTPRPTSPPPSPSPGFCFSAEDTINVIVDEKVETILVRELRVGDLVESGVNNEYSEVIHLAHFDVYDKSEAISSMRQLCTNSGCITLSYIHLLYVKKMNNMNDMVLIPSREVEVGDSLIVSSGHYENSFNDSKVIKINEHIDRYPRTIITASGNVVINGVLASCYTGDSDLYHTVEHFIVKSLYYIFEIIDPSFKYNQEKNMEFRLFIYYKIMKPLLSLFH